MSYDYEEQKQALFTEEGQVLFLKIRDNVQGLLLLAGAFRLQEVLKGSDGWSIMACVDRMVELDEITEITPAGCVAQHRVFIKGSK